MIRRTASCPRLVTRLTRQRWSISATASTVGARTLYSVLTAGAVALLWWLGQWKLLGYRW